MLRQELYELLKLNGGVTDGYNADNLTTTMKEQLNRDIPSEIHHEVKVKQQVHWFIVGVAAVMTDWRSPPVPAPQTAWRARSAGPTRAETPSPFTAPGTGRQPAGCDSPPQSDPPLKEKGLGKVGRDERLGDPRLIVLVYSTHLVRCPSPLTPSHCTDHSTTDKSSCIF